MLEPISYDIATLGTIVAALVGVAKGLGLPVKFAPVVAMGLAAVFVFLPEVVRQGVMMTAVIGLIATGAYSYVKPKDEKPPS